MSLPQSSIAWFNTCPGKISAFDSFRYDSVERSDRTLSLLNSLHSAKAFPQGKKGNSKLFSWLCRLWKERQLRYIDSRFPHDDDERAITITSISDPIINWYRPKTTNLDFTVNRYLILYRWGPLTYRVNKIPPMHWGTVHLPALGSLVSWGLYIRMMGQLSNFQI